MYYIFSFEIIFDLLFLFTIFKINHNIQTIFLVQYNFIMITFYFIACVLQSTVIYRVYDYTIRK